MVATRYALHTITTPKYFVFLNNHFSSIRKSLKNRKPTHTIFCSRANESQRKTLEKIVRPYENVTIISNENYANIGKARNVAFEETSAEWSIFFDADITLRENYFDELERAIDCTKTKNVSALTGCIGPSQASELGLLESLTDMRAFLRRVSIKKNVFNELLKKECIEPLFKGNYEQYANSAISSLKKFEGYNVVCLHGCNSIIKTEDLKILGGFDEESTSGEDRELAIRLVNNHQNIAFYPGLWVNHDYTFTLKDILRRKRIHGISYGELRRKFSHDDLIKISASDFIKSFLKSLAPPFPFNSFLGRIYSVAAYVGYTYGALSSEFFGLNPYKIKKGDWSYSNLEK